MNNETVYKVTKVKVTNESSDRYVKQGYTTTGNVTCEVGKSMFVDGNGFLNYLQTSAVKKIVDCENGNYMVETVNSVYSLEKQ